MKPSLIPYSFNDRLAVSMAFVFLAISVHEFADGKDLWGGGFLAMCIAFLINAYLLQDRPQVGKGAGEYVQNIKQLHGIGVQLQGVAQFLADEQTRLEASERALAALQSEHAELEPIVRMKRETVEQLLRAQHAYASRGVWKERIVGFTLGVFASVVASFIYVRLPWQ